MKTLLNIMSEMGLEPTRKIHTHLKRTCLPFHHSDVVSILLFICQFCVRLRGGCCSFEQPSRKTIHYVISWSLALNGSAVICFINCIYSANKPSPSARSSSAEYHSDVFFYQLHIRWQSTPQASLAPFAIHV